MLPLKEYQQHTLNALRTYFRYCNKHNDANLAFYEATLGFYGQGLPYNPIPGIEGLPYVCMRIPTGGGKTLVACHAVHVAFSELLQTDRHLVLWLVPSNAILDQTLGALADNAHPYRAALESRLGDVTAIGMPEALSLNRATLDTSTTILVSTMQAFRVEDTEGRKVYEASGDLMAHFSGFPEEMLEQLESRDEGGVICSLANVLRLRRPVVIVDEAHNARTDLSFETLSRFSPSVIMEFTATPDTSRSPSNVLYSVSAAELNAEDMIKLPIILENHENWRELLGIAISKRENLELYSKAERQLTGEYVRPVMLLQAQANRGPGSLTVGIIEETLTEEYGIPLDQIARATGKERGLEGVDILDESCPIRYVVTIQALKEGWDCPFAYILFSVAELSSGVAVEQILGRIMRLPEVTRKQQDELNHAYAYVASSDFVSTASTLVDGLIQIGFERIEAKDLVVGVETQLPIIEDVQAENLESVSLPMWIELQEDLDTTSMSDELTKKLNRDEDTGYWTVTARLTKNDYHTLMSSISSGQVKEVLLEAYADVVTREPSQPALEVPVLAHRLPGTEPTRFDSSHITRLLDLSKLSPTLDDDEFPGDLPPSRVAEIDLEEDKLRVRFLDRVQEQTRLIHFDRGWEPSDLVAWIDRSLPDRSDIQASDSIAYLVALVRHLMEVRGISLERLVYDKYRLRNAVAQKTEAHRLAQRTDLYQRLLDLDDTRLEVTPACCFKFDPERYPFKRQYSGHHNFKKHFYDVVGDFHTSEEEECAVFIDNLNDVETWVRNPSRGSKAFWLQLASGRFYPDFVCRLLDGRTLVVEYKGEDRWSNEDSTEKRIIGEVWEKLSRGKCLFIMPKGKDFGAIESKIARL